MPILVYPLIFLAAVLPVYIAVEYKARSPWKKLWLKAACSMFFIAAAAAAIAASPGHQGSARLFLAAFVLSAAGDVLLALPVRQSFKAGLGTFLLAQLLFTTAFCTRWGLSAWDAATFAVLAGAALVTLLKSPFVEPGGMRLPLAAYALALSAMAAKAVSGVTIAGGPGAWAAAAGGLLFYCSDVVLAFILFGKKRPPCLRAVNLALYYAGQGLLALSLLWR